MVEVNNNQGNPQNQTYSAWNSHWVATVGIITMSGRNIMRISITNLIYKLLSNMYIYSVHNIDMIADRKLIIRGFSRMMVNLLMIIIWGCIIGIRTEVAKFIIMIHWHYLSSCTTAKNYKNHVFWILIITINPLLQVQAHKIIAQVSTKYSVPSNKCIEWCVIKTTIPRITDITV